jgi:hypothetical protein
MNKKLILTGFLTEHDKYNRIKLMFLSDYEMTKKNTFDTASSFRSDFTKDYITNKNKYYKSKNPDSCCPTINKKYYYIKCKKNQKGLMPLNKLEHLKDDNIEEYTLIQSTTDDYIVNVDIKYLLQHVVNCVVEVNEYKFNLSGVIKEGYNFKLKKIALSKK